MNGNILIPPTGVDPEDHSKWWCEPPGSSASQFQGTCYHQASPAYVGALWQCICERYWFCSQFSIYSGIWKPISKRRARRLLRKAKSNVS